MCSFNDPSYPMTHTTGLLIRSHNIQTANIPWYSFLKLQILAKKNPKNVKKNLSKNRYH
jgi:hypothetical protein